MSGISEISKKLLKDKKLLLKVVGIIIALFLVPYITIPVLLGWWFYKKSKFSKKFKQVATGVAGAVLITLMTMGFIAYANDKQPHLVVSDPSGDFTTKEQKVFVKGSYDPVDRAVWINGEKVSTKNGSFLIEYPLKEGKNALKIETGNWKRASKTVTVTRELTEEEKSAKNISTPENNTVTSSPKNNIPGTEKYDANNKKALSGGIVEESICRDAYYSLMSKNTQSTITFTNPDIPKGTMLNTVWSNYLQKQPTVSGGGYFYYPDSDGKCMVGFSVTFDSGMKNIYQYIQEGNTFTAKNAPAMDLTPELAKKPVKENLGLTAKEQEIYDYGMELNNEYMSIYSPEVAEQKTLTDTAKKYGITEDEIIVIMDKATRQMIKNLDK